MEKVKGVAKIVTILGIVALTVGGATEVEVTSLVPIGIGVGVALSAIFAMFKK